MKQFLLSLAILCSLAAHAQPITDTGTLRSRINTDVVTNGTKAITGSNLNRILNGFLNTYPGGITATSPLTWNAGTRTLALPGWNAGGWNAVSTAYSTNGLILNATSPQANASVNVAGPGVFGQDMTSKGWVYSLAANSAGTSVVLAKIPGGVETRLIATNTVNGAVGTTTNHPFQIMANTNVGIIVKPNGTLRFPFHNSTVTQTPTGTYYQLVTDLNGDVYAIPATGGGGGGTYTAGSALTLAGSSFNLGGLATSAMTISGNSYAMSLGTSGSRLASASIYTSSDLNLQTGLKLATFDATTDGDLSVGSLNINVILSATLSANRTLSLPAPSVGKILFIHNRNGTGFTWQFGTGVVKEDGTTATTFPNGTLGTFISDGTNWVFKNGGGSGTSLFSSIGPGLAVNGGGVLYNSDHFKNYYFENSGIGSNIFWQASDSNMRFRSIHFGTGFDTSGSTESTLELALTGGGGGGGDYEPNWYTRTFAGIDTLKIPLSTYAGQDFRIVLSNLKSGGDFTSLKMRVKLAGGSYLTGETDYVWNQTNTNSGSSNTAAEGVLFFNAPETSQTNGFIDGEIKINGAFLSPKKQSFFCNIWGWGFGSSTLYQTTVNNISTAGAIDYVTIYFPGTTISGTVKLKKD